MKEPLLQVRDLKTYFYTDEGVVPAVDGLGFDLDRERTLAIVGESGCGKSVASLSVLGLIQPPGKVLSGEIRFEGQDLFKKTERQLLKIRGNDIAMIFQEPMTSLNPVFTICQQISESLIYHRGATKAQARRQALEMLVRVRIPNPEKVLDDYPHQLSGGMRQRVMIAMALACRPKILIADEPTTALDVTIQAQILSLLNDLKRETNTAIILITHDLGVVAQTADDILVMYAGQAVESAPARPLFKNPLHPYTQGLLRSIPKITENVERLYNIVGTIPSAKDYPQGCRFAPRCDRATARCFDEPPALADAGDGHWVRCWRAKGGDAR